jgi:hypothetical protein
VRLTVIFPASLWSAWSMSYGLVDTLRRLGHEVEPIAVNPQQPRTKIIYPKRDDSDGVIVSGPEHLMVLLSPRKPNDAPVVGWLHESVQRPDYELNVDAIKRVTDCAFCPAIQDTRHGFAYLPLGVDTEVFKPADTPKDIAAGFIGLLYPKRQDFLKQLAVHLNGTRLVCGNVQVLEMDGLNPHKTAELYAENIRRMKVFVNLPMLSDMVGSKVYEVLACGTYLLTPDIPTRSNFKDLPVEIYHDAPDAAIKLKHALKEEHPAVTDWFHDNNRLELRCATLVDALKGLA